MDEIVSIYFAQKFAKQVASSVYSRKKRAVIKSSPFFDLCKFQADKIGCTIYEYSRALYHIGESGCAYATALWFIDYKLNGYSVGTVRHPNLTDIVNRYFIDNQKGLITYDLTVNFSSLLKSYGVSVTMLNNKSRPDKIHIEQWNNGSITHYGIFKGTVLIYDTLYSSRTFASGRFIRSVCC